MRDQVTPGGRVDHDGVGLLDFLARNHARLPFDKILSHRYPLDSINEAFEAADWQARQIQVTRAVIVP